MALPEAPAAKVIFVSFSNRGREVFAFPRGYAGFPATLVKVS
jgi:hypothetical protein